MTHLFLLLLGTIVYVLTAVSAAPRPRKVHVSYPIDLLGTNSDTYSGNLTLDKLTCFGNRDYGVPTYRETLLCMIRLPMGLNCHSIWGSRSVVVEVIGSVEFLKLNRLPPGSIFNEFISLNATRWMELAATSSSVVQREVRQVPAEPIYLCARSNDWTGAPAQFFITFRPVFLRVRDKQLCHSKTLVHILLVIAVSSIWLLPYIAAMVVAALTFMHGIKFIIAIVSFSCCIVSLTPLMLTKKNRHLARLYFNYFFTRIQAEETRMVFRQKLPVFQALFFSCALVCIGSGGSYIIYTYCGIDRELRNLMLKITIGIASSWFVFFLCRSFERFCRDWVWVPMSVCLAQLLDLHLNPLSRDEVVVATLLISLGVSLTFPKIARAAQSRMPKGAGAVAPRLRLWANKVRYSLLRQKQLDEDQSVSAAEYMSSSLSSMAFEEDDFDNDTLKGYATPQGYMNGFTDDDNGINGNDYDNKYDNYDQNYDSNYDGSYDNEISDRRDDIGTRDFRYEVQRSQRFSKDDTCTHNNSHLQLWETLPILSDPVERELRDGVFCGNSTVNEGFIDNRSTSRSRRGSIGSVGLLDLFLGNSEDLDDNEDDVEVGEKDTVGKEIDGHDDDGDMEPRREESNVRCDIRRRSGEERNRLALSQAVRFDLSSLRLNLPALASLFPHSPSVQKEVKEDYFHREAWEAKECPFQSDDKEEKEEEIVTDFEGGTDMIDTDEVVGNDKAEVDDLVQHYFSELLISMKRDQGKDQEKEKKDKQKYQEGHQKEYQNNHQENRQERQQHQQYSELPFTERNPSSSFTHLVGAMNPLPLSALGPLLLDGCQVWIPLATRNSLLLKKLQKMITAISKSNCSSCVFLPEKEYHCSSALFSCTSFSDALFMQRWINRQSNMTLLRSIAMGMDSEVPSGDYLIVARAIGREVKVVLKILIDCGNDHQLSDSFPLLAEQWEQVGLEAMQRVVLAAMEVLNETITVTLLKLDGNDSKKMESVAGIFSFDSGFLSVGLVSVEGVLTDHILQAMGYEGGIEKFLNASKLYNNSFSASLQSSWLKVTTALMAAIGLDTSTAHSVLSFCKIEIHLTLNIQRNTKTVKYTEISDMKRNTKMSNNPDPLFSEGEEEEYNEKKLEVECSSNNRNDYLSISIMMPLALTEPSDESETDADGDKYELQSNIPRPDEDVAKKGSRHSKDPTSKKADTCYKLLVDSLDCASRPDTANDLEGNTEAGSQGIGHSASRALAGALLATYLSLVVDFCNGDFYRALTNKKQ